MMAEVGRRRYQRSAKRRSDAVTFLTNISLDGNFSQTEDSPVKAEEKNDNRGEKGTGRNASNRQEKQASDSTLCVQGRVREITETDASTSEVAVNLGVTEGFTPEVRGVRTRSVAKSVLGVSSGSLRLKSFSSDWGSPLIPSKFDPGSRPRAQTQVTSSSAAAADLTKWHPHQGSAIDVLAFEGAVHKPPHHHHHHRHHTTLHSVLSSQSQTLRTDTDAAPLGSPKERPASTSMYFVQSLPHHSNKPSRVLLVTTCKVPFSLFSVLPYSRRSQHGILRNDSDSVSSGRTRKSSGTRGVGSETYLSNLAGVELGDGAKEISYRHLLVPTNDQMACRRQHNLDILVSPHSPAPRKIPGHPLAIQWDRGDSEMQLLDHGTNLLTYDPMELDDPGLHTGKHSKVMTFSSYMVSILDYTKPSELKKDINQKFKDKFPHIDLSLSKLRSIKRDMKKIAVEVGTMELLTLAHAYVYFEKLALYGKINKENRKLCAAACLTLAAKLSDTKGAELQNLIKEIEDTFRENRKDFLQLEFPITVALEFSLHLPESIVLPHYRRIAQLT